ncbi:hypothetical protein WJX72_001389 [[Myrmecia] bisecta]|uniref:FAD-binding PCMH-type domain-containing protein n=1 Tax=[Myrmecia] bisecta TaxID=41462 RepID=A0AAW1R4D8_9CHLO
MAETTAIALLLVLLVQPCRAAQVCSDTHNFFANLCGPSTSHLNNFQGHHACDPHNKLIKPKNVAELQAVVRSHAKVRAVGAGHSWHKDLFCSGDVNVYLSELETITPLYTAHAQGTRLNVSASDYEDFPIRANLTAMTVTVDAGVPQRMLIEYLLSLGDGYIFGSSSGLIDQTIGGAVATGTHGSSTLYGSISEQVVAMEVVVADGSLRTFTKEGDPHLFRALQVSLGRLGILTKVTLPIIKQPAYDRVLIEEDTQQTLAYYKGVQDGYNRLAAAAKGGGATAHSELGAFLTGLDQMTGTWGPVTKVGLRGMITLNNTAKPVYSHWYQPVAGLPLAGFDEQGRFAANKALIEQAETIAPLTDLAVKACQANGTALSAYEVHQVLGHGRQGWVDYDNQGLLDMWEVAVPMSVIGDCLEKVVGLLEGEGSRGFFDFIVFRVTRQEAGYLSYGADGPAVFMNINDWAGSEALSLEHPNVNFLGLQQLLRDECQAKFHWGKAGWQTVNSCFDGATAYPTTWCHFGCAVQELDPTGKFAGESDMWRWRAAKGGKEVPFIDCCSSEGFDYGQCSCLPRADCMRWRVPETSAERSEL